MANLKFVVVALALCYVVVEGKALYEGQDIPLRCITNSITKVSCETADSQFNLVPHPDDCQLFYYCVSSDQLPICRQCPAELHFNPVKRVCDAPENAGCYVNVTVSSLK